MKKKIMTGMMITMLSVMSMSFYAKADMVPYVPAETFVQAAATQNAIGQTEATQNQDNADDSDGTDKLETTEKGPGIAKKTDKASEVPVEEKAASEGEQVVDYAVQFVGNPYVYGGTSLTKGADCSGFVMSVFQKFGKNLPRTSGEQGKTGTAVNGLNNAKPGDLISYPGHIGIYMGNNQLVHASNAKDGIKISAATYRPIQSIRRLA